MKRVTARLAEFVLAAGPAVILATMGYAERWVTEDAFIDLRVVQQILAGRGPVFNVGERVEAYTSPLWVALLAGWGALGGPLEMGSVLLGLLCSVLGLMLAQVGAWRLASLSRHGPEGGSADPTSGWIAPPLGAAVFAAVPVVWDFVTSGLESGLVIGWLGGTFWLLARRRLASTGGLRAAAFVIGCGPLVRPDLGLFAVAFALVLIVIRLHGAADRPAAREWIVLPLIAGTLPVGYQVFRMGFFAAVVPNAALAKEASLAYWSQGWRYTLDFIGPYALWLPTLVAAAWVAALLTRARRAGDRITTALILGPTLAALAHWLYVTRVGGDFMHGRLLVPTLFAFLLPVATVVVPARSRPTWRIAGLAAVGGWAVICALWLRVPYAGRGAPGRWGIADEHGFYQRQTNTRSPVAISTYARQPRAVRFLLGLSTFGGAVVVKEGAGLVRLASLSPSVRPSVPMVLGLPNVGILGYLAGLDTHVVDQLGLADPIASRMALTSRGRPGHEKWLSRDWIAGRFGDPKATSLPAPAVDVARAVGCGDLARLLRAVNDPLTVSRFLANVRASWALSRLRIPADPASARDRFCSAPAGS